MVFFQEMLKPLLVWNAWILNGNGNQNVEDSQPQIKLSSSECSFFIQLQAQEMQKAT